MNCSIQRKAYCLMGPTAIGKSSLALELAKKLPLEIISVDSAMVYHGMDIGTAKPTHEQLQAVPHHLLNICEPHDPYSAGQFSRDALQKITEIFARQHIPLLVGGTMLYFHVLQRGIATLPPAERVIRDKIQKQIQEYGVTVLYSELQKIDPLAAARIHKNDIQRLQRALEVFLLTGKSIYELQQINAQYTPAYTFINIIIAPSILDNLRQRIKQRVQSMLDLGLVAEVRKLYQRTDLHSDLPALRAVGYSQVWQYLARKITYEQMVTLIAQATGQLAKRQLTWLKKWQDAAWFMDDDSDLVAKVCDYILSCDHLIKSGDCIC